MKVFVQWELQSTLYNVKLNEQSQYCLKNFSELIENNSNHEARTFSRIIDVQSWKCMNENKIRIEVKTFSRQKSRRNFLFSKLALDDNNFNSYLPSRQRLSKVCSCDRMNQGSLHLLITCNECMMLITNLVLCLSTLKLILLLPCTCESHDQLIGQFSSFVSKPRWSIFNPFNFSPSPPCEPFHFNDNE